MRVQGLMEQLRHIVQKMMAASAHYCDSAVRSCLYSSSPDLGFRGI